MGQNESTAQSEASESNDTEAITMQRHTSEYEFWKPDRLNPALAELNEDDRKTMSLRRSVISILNKLTPENFPTLSQQMRALSIDTSVQMQQVVEIIHAKAILEWKFRALYAKICELMQDVKVDDGDAKAFSIHLIAQCETFFQTSLSEDFRFGRQKNEETEKLSVRDNEQNERDFGRKAVGNCQFIGELFKVYLIHPKIIFLILDQLSKSHGNLAVECKCALLTTIGLFYEEKIKKLPAVYFHELELLLLDGQIPSRIRFIIQDVLDLKKNSWRPRRLLELPKTLEQIERDLIEGEKNQKLSESMSRLDYFLKNSTGDVGKIVSHSHLANWTKISTYFFNDDVFETENNQNEIQVGIPDLSEKSFEDSVRAILGDLSTENLEWSTKMMKQLPINKQSKLNFIAISIHEEALDKPEQCKLYAEMCHALENTRVSSSGSMLGTIIVQRCECRFNCDKTLKVEDYGTEFYRQSLANCRFMGELYKVQVLNNVSLLRCVNKLLLMKSPDKKCLECLYELLYVAGKRLYSELKEESGRKNTDNSKTKKLINRCQVLLEENRSNMSSEMENLLEDLISMRRSQEDVTIREPERCISAQLVDGIVPLKNHEDKEQVENIVQPEANTTDSSVLDNSTSEYFKTGANAVDELSSNSPEKLSPMPEKSYRSELTGGKPVDKEAVPSTKLNENLVSHAGKKHTVEFLKSLRDVPESKRLLKVNIPDGMYSDRHTLESVSSKKLNENLVSQDRKKHTVEFLKSLRDVPESKRLLKVNIPDGMYSDCHIWTSKRKNQQNEPRNVPPPSIRVTSSLPNAFLSYSPKDNQTQTELPLKSKNLPVNQAEIQNLRNSLNDILNDIPSKNIGFVFENVHSLAIHHVSKIHSVLDIIYDRAINEPDNCQRYAELCRMMQNLNLPDEESGKFQTFRILLINKCQEVFESGMAVVLDELKKPEEIGTCINTEMKKELKSLYEQNKSEFCRKMVGNCRLIGELCKLQMLTTKIMLRCLTKFLPPVDDVSLECLCTLLKIVGKELEIKLSTFQKKEFASFFEKLQKLLENDEYRMSFRIKSMLRDVINLKNNQWISVPENNEPNPSNSSENVQISATLAPNLNNLSADEKKTQELYKSVTEILNEFTSSTIYLLQKKIKELPINKAHKLQGVIDLIHSKAVNEPTSCKSCAELCFLMGDITVCDADSCSMKTFRTLLINKCQQELEIVLENYESIPHQKAIANYRFVGEAFKFNMLTVEFILRWTNLLLELANDVSLKCLCTLLKIIGEYLSPEQEKKFTLCFKKIQDISKNENHQISPKVRSMLQDVINLMNNQWIPVPAQKININSNSEKIDERNQEIRGQELKISTDGTLKNKDEISTKNRPTDLFRILRSVLNHWILNENLPDWFESTKHGLNSELLPGTVSEIIQFVMKSDSQIAEKCGLMFAHLIEQGDIQSSVIIKGLGYFLNTVENREVLAKLEPVLSPLFKKGLLKIHDLNTISQSDSDVKPIENKEKATIISQNESAPKKQKKNLPSGSQPKLQTIPGQQKLIPPSSHSDPFFSDSSVPNSKFDAIPKSTRQFINDLLKTVTPYNFKLPSFERKLENMPFQKIVELEFAAFCIIERVEKKPELYEFFFGLCCPMLMLTAEKIRFWMVLIKDCHTYFHQKIFPKETSSDQIIQNKLKGFCRFFSLLVNKLNNRTANVSVQRILRKLLDIRKIEYLCEIYYFLEYTVDRFEKSLFESYIPELLSSNELEIEFQNMLKRVFEDYAKKISISSKIIPSKNLNLHQVAATGIIDKGIDLQKKVVKPSNVPNDVKNSSICFKEPIVDKTLNNEIMPKNALKNLDDFPKKKKKKKKNDKTSSSSIVDLNLPVENQTPSIDCRSNVSNNQSEPSTSNSNLLPKNQNSNFVSTASSAGDKPFLISHKEMNEIVTDVLNQLQLCPYTFLKLSQRMLSMPIEREARLADIAHRICSKAMQDYNNSKLYVVLCEHLLNWSIIDRNTGKVAVFKVQLIAVLHSRRYQLNLKIKEYLESAKLEPGNYHEFVIKYCRLLLEFLKSPFFGSDLSIVPALELLLLNPIDKDVMEILNEFLIIFKNDLNLKLEILGNQIGSHEVIGCSSPEFEKYNVMLKMIEFLQEMIDFQKYDHGLNYPEHSEKRIEANDEKNENGIDSFRKPDQVPENRRISPGEDLDSFLKTRPYFIENIIKCFEEERKNPDEFIDSTIKSLCSFFDSNLKIQGSESDDDKFSYALLLKIFSKYVPSFESRCINTVLEFTKMSNFQPGILSKFFEFFFLYGIISYQSMVQFKNTFVSNRISEIIKMLNSSIFQEYKLTKNTQMK